jgi:hypothetical protein
MRIEEYRGFQIQVYNKGKRIIAEVYRKDKLIHTIQDSKELGEHFQSNFMALEAIRDWIDHTYPKDRISYSGEI